MNPSLEKIVIDPRNKVYMEFLAKRTHISQTLQHVFFLILAAIFFDFWTSENHRF